MDSDQLDRFLADRGIHLERHEHPPVMTVDEADRLVPALPASKTKNLFLRDKKGARHLLVTVPSDCAVDLAALGRLTGISGAGFGHVPHVINVPRRVDAI